MEFTMKPIGEIHSPFTDKNQTPIQPSRLQAVGQGVTFQQVEGVRMHPSRVSWGLPLRR